MQAGVHTQSNVFPQQSIKLQIISLHLILQTNTGAWSGVYRANRCLSCLTRASRSRVPRRWPMSPLSCLKRILLQIIGIMQAETEAESHITDVSYRANVSLPGHTLFLLIGGAGNALGATLVHDLLCFSEQGGGWGAAIPGKGLKGKSRRNTPRATNLVLLHRRRAFLQGPCREGASWNLRMV